MSTSPLTSNQPIHYEEIPETPFHPSQKDNPSLKNQKLLQYLETLEKNCSLDKSMNLYQERFHCIHKAINSIKQHSDCYVSDFLSHYKPTSSPLHEKDEDSNNSPSHPHPPPPSLSNATKDKEIDDLLHYIENELHISNTNSSKVNSSNTSSSANSNTPIKDNKINNKRLSKVFLKIELKLKTHLEEQKVLQDNNNSILDNSYSTKSINGSISCMNENNKSFRKHRHSYLPKVMRNFFVDKENMEKSNQQRKSVFTKGRIRSSLKNSELVSSSFKKKLSVSECNFGVKGKLGLESGRKEISRFDNGNIVISDFVSNCNDDEYGSDKSENSKDDSYVSEDEKDIEQKKEFNNNEKEDNTNGNNFPQMELISEEDCEEN